MVGNTESIMQKMHGRVKLFRDQLGGAKPGRLTARGTVICNELARESNVP